MLHASKTGALALLSVTAWAFEPIAGTAATTYRILELSSPGDVASFATGVNRSNQVSGYSIDPQGSVHAWRFSPPHDLVVLGSLGGPDTRALSINDSGTVVGSATDAEGNSHAFSSDGRVLVDLGSLGFASSNLVAQHISNKGDIFGFSNLNGEESPFRLTPPDHVIHLGPLGSGSAPTTAAAYGGNNAGQVVGIASWPDGFNRAFRTTSQSTLQDLGTLGGDESWAYAINSVGQIVGSASAITTDTHAFRFSPTTGMIDLGTLGGYQSQAFALDETGRVVGTAERRDRSLRAFLWSDPEGMRDLGELIPLNLGWELAEARGIAESGAIVGNGRHQGQPRAFLLTPVAEPDLDPPVAVLQANDITNIVYAAQLFQVVFWDDGRILESSLTTNCIRVTGPDGYNQIATAYGAPVTNGPLRIAASFYVNSPSGLWNGTNNGVYSVSLEPDTVRDIHGNVMPSQVIGTFTVAAETRPTVSLGISTTAVMQEPATFLVNARSSFPYAPDDVFVCEIDWESDGTDHQSLTVTNGTPITHVFRSIGVHTTQIVATDPHGLRSAASVSQVWVGNPAYPFQWTNAPALTGNRRLAIGLNSGGTLVCLGGLPLRSGGLQAQTLTPGAASFVDGRRLTVETQGLGAGVDSLGRIILYGGIEPGAADANRNGYVYSPVSGAGAAIATKQVPVHDFAFCEDELHRLYSIGGAIGSGLTTGTRSVERYDAQANAWTTLADLPAPRINGTAAPDGQGHLFLFGGIDPTTGQPTSSVFSYDIAANTWSQVAGAPGAGLASAAGRVAALGADGLIYVVGGLSFNAVPSAEVLVYDPRENIWLTGPSLSTARGTPAVALGSDGFLYVMGGDGPPKGGGGGGNNGLSSVERLDTRSAHPPRIISTPGDTANVQVNFFYQALATGNPRPSYSLLRSPAGMQIDPLTGFLQWTPTLEQAGTHAVTLRATSASGAAEQIFSVTVRPPPGDTIAPTAPTNFFAAFRTSSSITFTWSPGSDDRGVVSYNVYNLQGSRSRHWVLVGSGITNRSFITGVGAFAPSFAVASVDAAGNVSPLKIGSANSLTLPTIRHAGSNEPSSIILGNAFLFTVSTTATPTPGFSRITGPPGMTLTRIPGPDPLADYAVIQWQPTAEFVGTNQFTVYATNANTTGGSSTFTVVVLPGETDLSPPTPVARMTASDFGFDRCRLTWTPAGDNIGVVNYALQAIHFGFPSNHVVRLNASGTTTTLLLTDLLASASYTVSITPSDAAGNIGPSTSIFFSTLARPEIALQLIPGSEPGTLVLKWNWSGAGSRYTVESTASLSLPNWVPVAPQSQWPAEITQLTLTPESLPPHQFYRVSLSP